MNHTLTIYSFYLKDQLLQHSFKILFITHKSLFKFPNLTKNYYFQTIPHKTHMTGAISANPSISCKINSISLNKQCLLFHNFKTETLF
jgi:hypothetical protein